jgi:protein TonB
MPVSSSIKFLQSRISCVYSRLNTAGAVSLLTIVEDTMFADSLFDSSLQERTRRRWTTLASFALQALGLGVALAIPILYTEGLPELHLRELFLGPPPAAAPASPPPSQAAVVPRQTNMIGHELMAPRQIPNQVAHIEETVAPPPIPDGGSGLGIAHGTGNPEINNIARTLAAVAPPPPLAPRRPVIASRMMEGNLIHRVEPTYPAIAISARIQGSVILQATISRNGSIENVQALSGHPMLIRAAIDAVRQWKYRPYYLNDQPVEVETQVTVNFILAR